MKQKQGVSRFLCRTSRPS